MKEENKRKKSTKYLIIGTLVLFLSILGASMAYYLARVSGSFGGSAAGTELAINVEKLSSNATGDLIPLDNDLETLNLAAAGYDNNGACVDINGYSVCQIYHITLTNNGSVPLTVNGTVTLSGQNVPNIDCAKMDNTTTIANNNSCMSGMFVSGDTLAANDYNDYYVMVYINNLDESQYDSGEFNGTVTFTTEDGKKVKGRFTKPFNLAEHITNLYNNEEKTVVTANAEGTCDLNAWHKCENEMTVTKTIDYNYATNVKLMKDRLGGTSTTLDSGNIRYYGAEPNNWIDIGDKYETDAIQGNWESFYSQYGFVINNSDECKRGLGITDETTEEQMSQMDAQIAQVTNYNYSTVEEFCSTKIIPAGTPILWRIIGVFDGKLRIRRNENIGNYAFDTSDSSVHGGTGINQWGQSGDYEGADLMKLLNPGYETNQDSKCTYDEENDAYNCENGLVNNSLYWNSGSGTCYYSTGNLTIDCDFTNTGLSEEAKEYVVD